MDGGLYDNHGQHTMLLLRYDWKALYRVSRDHKGKVRNRPRKDIADAVTQFNSGDSYTDQDGLGNTSPYVIYEYD